MATTIQKLSFKVCQALEFAQCKLSDYIPYFPHQDSHLKQLLQPQQKKTQTLETTAKDNKENATLRKLTDNHGIGFNGSSGIPGMYGYLEECIREIKEMNNTSETRDFQQNRKLKFK